MWRERLYVCRIDFLTSSTFDDKQFIPIVNRCKNVKSIGNNGNRITKKDLFIIEPYIRLIKTYTTIQWI